ncbi:MAG: LapA family protein [Deltaproteobacteria bacterium]|nr:LapA family protein [Deltaproteobacteria bacterium]
MYISLIVTFALILGVTIFALQNGMPLEVKFIVWGFHTSLIAVILGSALVGVLIMAVISMPGLVKERFRAKKLQKRVRELENKSQELEHQLMEKRETSASTFASGIETQ